VRGARPYMSIGEVLGALKEEFPDITVSKIRFLESEGLIEPERTPSGYRKFYEKDLDRLRFILTLQRDSYLPLKVIRQRLAARDAGLVSGDGPAAVPRAPGDGAASPPEPAPAAAGAPARPALDPDEELAAPPTALHLSEADLAAAAGLEPAQVASLREHGVICPHPMNGTVFYDEDDLVVGRIARDFLRYGVEARHLKMFRQFAEREAALFEQIVLPALRNPRPETRREAIRSLGELARLSRKLLQAFLRRSLRGYLAGDGGR
jgi:DNA-binding transcriptional MerR regulator